MYSASCWCIPEHNMVIWYRQSLFVKTNNLRAYPKPITWVTMTLRHDFDRCLCYSEHPVAHMTKLPWRVCASPGPLPPIQSVSLPASFARFSGPISLFRALLHSLPGFRPSPPLCATTAKFCEVLVPCFQLCLVDATCVMSS